MKFRWSTSPHRPNNLCDIYLILPWHWIGLLKQLPKLRHSRAISMQKNWLAIRGLERTLDQEENIIHFKRVLWWKEWKISRSIVLKRVFVGWSRGLQSFSRFMIQKLKKNLVPRGRKSLPLTQSYFRGQWLGLCCLSGRFLYLRSAVRIQSSA